MVNYKYFMTRNDGVVLIEAKSDCGKYIISNETGAMYESAVDPENLNRTYMESEEYIPTDEENKETE